MARQRRRTGVQKGQTLREEAIHSSREWKRIKAIMQAKRREEVRLMQEQLEVARMQRINQLAQEKYSVIPATLAKVESAEVHPPLSGDSFPDET